MRISKGLADVELWCLGAKPGDEKIFYSRERVTQADASAFARKLNEERSDHIWIQVGTCEFNTGILTTLSVRCTP